MVNIAVIKIHYCNWYITEFEIWIFIFLANNTYYYKETISYSIFPLYCIIFITDEGENFIYSRIKI